MSTHALASLTATYTDSEPEGEDEDKVLQDDKEKSESDSDRSEQPEDPPASVLAPPQPQRVATLVSYNDAEDDDEDGEPRRSPEAVERPPSPEPAAGSTELPPEPSGTPDIVCLQKYEKLIEKKNAGHDMNAYIQHNKAFRNPSIYEKLIQYCGLNELGTNYPPHLYDPLRWGKQSFYEEIAKVQKSEMDRLEKEKKARVEFISGTKKTLVDDDPKKRKSKWDQVGAGALGAGAAVRPPSLTTSISGTKSTVISAFGSLPKKPKM